MNSLARAGYLAGLALALVAVGCDSPKLPSGPPQAAAPAPEPAAVETPPGNSPGTDLPQIAEPVTNDPRPVTPDDPVKGRRSKRAGGYLGATAHAKFWAEHKIVFDQVKYNLGLYMAMEGDFPKSNEEFFEKIIKGYQMKLPALEPEHEYCYVPEEAELGLQIRLKQPGSPPEAAPQGAADASADANPPDPSAVDAASPQEAAPPQEEPSPDIRTRAGQLGEQRNEEVEKHGLAPGGLVPVGGIE